jgi:hypothetical protein
MSSGISPARSLAVYQALSASARSSLAQSSLPNAVMPIRSVERDHLSLARVGGQIQSGATRLQRQQEDRRAGRSGIPGSRHADYFRYDRRMGTDHHLSRGLDLGFARLSMTKPSLERQLEQ